MASIVAKRIKGKEYLYLVASIRKGERVIQKTIKYIGPKRPVPEEEFKCMEMSYKKEDWVLTGMQDVLSYQDHNKMKQASDSYKSYLRGLDAVSKEKEKEKFLSAFIANSNAIEGSTLTPKDTFNYLFQDIAPEGHSKKELFMASNMLEAWNYAEKNFSRFPAENDLLELHRLVNQSIETEATLGKYKPVQNYVGSSYTTSYLFVNERMDMLMRWIKAAFRKMDDFEVAFQSHAQFEIIHPFIDGNGRVGRILLNWLLMNRGLMYFAIRADKRQRYISAISSAQNRNPGAMSRFCFGEYMAQYSFVVVK